MKKNDIISRLQTMASAMREELSKNEGSTLQTLSSAIKSSYESVRASIAESERTKKALTMAKQYLDEAGKAIKKGDCKLSAKALDALDKLLKEHKEKEATEQKKPSAKKAPAKAPAAKKPTSAATTAKKAPAKAAGSKKAPAKPAAAKKAPGTTAPKGKTAAKN